MCIRDRNNSFNNNNNFSTTNQNNNNNTGPNHVNPSRPSNGYQGNRNPYPHNQNSQRSPNYGNDRYHNNNNRAGPNNGNPVNNSVTTVYSIVVGTVETK